MYDNHFPRAAIAAALIPLSAAAVWLSTGCAADHHPAPTSIDWHAAPTHLHWSPFDGMSLPFADQGPATLDDPVATGYTRTPAGAALAAIQTTVRMSLAQDTQYPQIGRLLAAGPGRDAWAIARTRISITAPVPAGTAPTLLGYRITSWSPDRAVLAIYTRQSDRSLTANTATVVWTDGDWKLALPAPPGTPLVAAVAATPPDLVALRPS